MKIQAIKAIPVRVPLKPFLVTRTAHGDHATSDYVIVRVETDEGLEGLGEATVSALWSGETSASCAAAIDGLIGPALVGLDPTAIHRARAVMDRLIKLNPFTKSAVEMALWDLAGKAAGVPVYHLLGGKSREVVPTKMMIGAFDYGHVRDLAREFLNWGVQCLKVKVGIGLDEDVLRVDAVRDIAGPDLPITVDANCGWNVATARLALERLSRFDLRVAEQPIAPGDLAAFRYLRESARMPLMADESVFTPSDAWNVANHQAADVISVYPGKNGGIGATVEVVHVAKAAGLVCHMGSNLELGIASAAMLHVASALPTIDSETYPADILGPHYHESDLLAERLDLNFAGATVPEGPGLGVVLDEDALARYRVK